MEQIDAVVDVLKNWRKYSSPDSTRGRSHSGLKHIKGHEELAANTILQRDWNGKKAVSSMYKMAQSVDLLLGLNLDWKQRTDLARLLLSSLTYSRIYKLAKANDPIPALHLLFSRQKAHCFQKDHYLTKPVLLSSQCGMAMWIR